MTSLVDRVVQAYSQPAGDLAGVQTFVNENNKKNLTPNTSKPTKDNWRSRPDAPEHKEQALPIAPDHRKTRDRERVNQTPGQPSYNGPPAADKQPDSKPLSQRMRTVPKPGDEYGSPYIDQGTLLNQRRTMTSGYSPDGPTVPLRPQRKQVGKAKTYYRNYYRKNKGKILGKAKRKYRTLKTNSRFKTWRKQMKNRPEKFERRPGGTNDPAKRSQKWREKQADFLRETISPADLAQTWQRKNNKGTPDGANQHAEIPDGLTTWVDNGSPREPQTPAHKPTEVQVDNNPGSAKVIPDGHDFANKMARSASRVASLYLTATKIAEIEQHVLPALLTKGQSLTPRLVRVDAPNRIWWFDVQGTEPKPYRVKVRVIPPNATVRKMDKVDVHLSCTCNFWRWQGPEYHAKQHSYLFGKPVGTASKPDVKDPNGKHWVCKHVAAVLTTVKKYDVPHARTKGKTAAAMWYLSSVLYQKSLAQVALSGQNSPKP